MRHRTRASRKRNASRDEVASGVKHGASLDGPSGLWRRSRQYLETMIPRVSKSCGRRASASSRATLTLSGKLVSLFEPHTEIIRKGKAAKPTEFGKMIKIQEAERQIITHYEVYDQRPNDADLLIPALEAHEQRLGRAPRLATADAAFLLGTRMKPPRTPSA